MYNRYLSTAYSEGELPYSQEIHTGGSHPGHPPGPEPRPVPPKKEPAGKGLFSGIGETFTDRLSELHFDFDTIVILIAVYFLLADSDDFDTELLIIIGVLFFLGL